MRGNKRQRKKYQKQRLRVRLLCGATIEQADKFEVAVALGPHPRKIKPGWMYFSFDNPVHMTNGLPYWISIVQPYHGRGKKSLQLAHPVYSGKDEIVEGVNVPIAKGGG